MRKYIFGVFIICIELLLVGCGKVTGPQANLEEPEDSYVYEQELHIVDDNYRNYYEIFLYSFCDSDGDGIGDINGLISKLDYINDGDDLTDSDLGFNGIWLMPIMQSTTYHKYDVVDYFTVDIEYGTNEDFVRLAEECEKREIKLIIDFVFNHTSAKHPWFIEAVSYLESLDEEEEPDLAVCPYVEYYNFTKEKKGDGYYKAGRSDYYYEGMFWDQMPDLNLSSENVRMEIEQIADFWMDMGADGFRLDAAKEFYSGSPEKNVEVLEWFQTYVTKKNPNAYLVAEVWDSEAKISTYYQSGITSLFNFPASQYNGFITMTARGLPNKTGLNLAKEILDYESAYFEANPNYIDAPFISNHDTTRISAQCVNDEENMKFSAGILLSLTGSPFVYYGEELGMNSSGSKDENKRLPMHWSEIPNDDTTDPPANADVVEQQFKSLEEQQKDKYSIYNYYKRAIRIRNENPEIARGVTEVEKELTTDSLCVLKRNYQEKLIYIIYNLGEDQEIEKIDGYHVLGYLSVNKFDVIENEDTYFLPSKSILYLGK